MKPSTSRVTRSRMSTKTKGHPSGFTLVELAVVIAIVALVLGALLVPLASQLQNRNIRETRDSLRIIHEALLGFAVTQGRLPCPDTDRDGLENPCGGVGNVWDVVEGFVPWQTLSVPATDAWGSIFRYAVTREFAEAAVPGAPPGPNQLDLTDIDSGNIQVNTRGDDFLTGPIETKTTIVLANEVPAVVLSVGNNGAGGSLLGGVDRPFATGVDELTNVSTIASVWVLAAPPRPFVQRVHSTAASGCSDTAEGQPFCEFDDLLIWISAPVLLNRMVEARQLP